MNIPSVLLNCGQLTDVSQSSCSPGCFLCLAQQADALVQVLPIIAASDVSTFSLLTVVGVLAPVLEESVFRGFLLPSLSKW